MKVIDGNGAVLGRLASYAAKEALKGEEIAVVNCDEIIITGNKQDIRERFEEKRTKVGSQQSGPKISRDIAKMVKRTIRGMLPNPRYSGVGRKAFQRIKCYRRIPKELESAKKIEMKGKKRKFVKISEVNLR
ncbi:50S ribosomal protein L13 [Candidatus Pacearchaeota archaeon]|nr:50S ribosomal protein L13 [Candidatus Pacearchaeota archaeon]